MPEGDYQKHMYTAQNLWLSAASMERVDTILQVSFRRAWKHIQGHAPKESLLELAWPVEEMRTSLLGQAVLVISAYANQSNWQVDEAEVKQAIHRVYHLLHGNLSDEGYTLPKDFYLSDLGSLIDQAHFRLYGSRAWVGMTKASKEVGVSRQSVYDRALEGKLRAIHWPAGIQRVLRADLEIWKAEREQERRAREREQERKKKRAVQAKKEG